MVTIIGNCLVGLCIMIQGLSRPLRSQEQTRKSKRVASKTEANRSQYRVILSPKISQFQLAKSLQKPIANYNSKGQYLPFFKNFQLHKFLFINRISHGKKFAIVFNGRGQLMSDIRLYIVGGCLKKLWLRNFII